jgi:hypothetical protein
LRGRGDARRDAPVAAVRTRGCGWGCAGRAMLADGWRIRGADGQGPDRALGASARVRCAAWVAPVRRLRLGRGLCGIGLVWVEILGSLVRQLWSGAEWGGGIRRVGAYIGWSAAVGSAAVWGLGLCGLLVPWRVCWRRDGA